MSAAVFDWAVVGGGLSATLAALRIAAAGQRVLQLQPTLDPDALPRPLPPADCEPWQRLWNSVAVRGTADLELRSYGGAVVHPFSQRALVEADYRGVIRAEAGTFVTAGVDQGWAWQEPAGGAAALWALLAERARQLPLEQRPWPRPLALQRGLMRRAQIVGLNEAVAHVLVFWPAPGTALRQAPRLTLPTPRAAYQGGAHWWADDAASVLWRSGGDPEAAPPGVAATLAPTARYDRPPPWGVVSCRGCTVALVPPPAARPPAAWAAWLAATIAPALGRTARQAA